MSKTEKSTLWVVYRMTIDKKGSVTNAVCRQSEWERMELARPGYHTLIQAGITNEGEAERLARNTPVDGNTSQSAEKTFGSGDGLMRSPPVDLAEPSQCRVGSLRQGEIAKLEEDVP
jgi:hypothetical protein